ncbi:MAG: hypothetical protein ACK46Q_09845 [Hyphomonas sp.]
MFKMLPDRFRDPVLLFALSCALALGWLLVGLVSVDTVDQVFAEAGPIESASALFLILGALLLLDDMVHRRSLERWHLATLTLAAGLRELDWDKAFTDRGILSSGLYSGAAPLAQKIGGAIVVGILIWVGLRLLRRNLGPWLTGLRAGRAWAWLMAIALVLYAVAKTLDGLGRKLAPWGIDLSASSSRAVSRIEEGLELFGAILILQVVGLSLLQSDYRYRGPHIGRNSRSADTTTGSV